MSGEALKMLGLDAGEVRHEVEKLIARGPTAVSNDNLPFTPRAKRVIEYAQQEAMLVNQKQVSADTSATRPVPRAGWRGGESSGKPRRLKLTEIRAEVLKTRLDANEIGRKDCAADSRRHRTANAKNASEELLAHLESIYTEELSSLSDPAEALKAAAKRFGDSSELAREFQRSLSGSDRIGYRMEPLVWLASR